MSKKSRGSDAETAIAALIDDAVRIQRERLALARQAEKKKAEENAAKTRIIKALIKARLNSVASREARATLGSSTVGTVKNWTKFYAHIQKTSAFELLERRLALVPARERWERNEAIPGVKSERITKVTITDLV